MQSSEQSGHLHRAWHFTDPDVHAGFKFIEMALHAKARLFHEVGGEESVHSRHDPGVFLDVAIREPKLGDRDVLSGFHSRFIDSYVERISSGCGT